MCVYFNAAFLHSESHSTAQRIFSVTYWVHACNTVFVGVTADTSFIRIPLVPVGMSTCLDLLL